MVEALPIPGRNGTSGLEARVFEGLVRAADHLLQGRLELLRLADLTFPQYSVLRILRGALPRGLSCGAISEQMLTRDSDLTRLLDRLAGRELVARTREPRDRRVVTATITEPGLQLLRKLDLPMERLQRQQLAHVGVAELETLEALAHRVHASHSEPPARPYEPREE
jgi:DNA-binding MarR family transcriptional regulator